jgi:RNA polymerase sigma-B factor
VRPLQTDMSDPKSDEPPASEYAGYMPLLRRLVELPDGDPARAALRDEVILGFLPVVEHLAARHAAGNPGVRDDLVQAGTIGLISAVDHWDPERASGEFLGYLVPCVRGEILRWFRDRTWAVRVPRRLKEMGPALNRATNELGQQLGRAPRPSELAAHMRVPVEDVIEAIDAAANHHAERLDAPDPTTGSSLAERVGDLDAAMANVEDREQLRPVLDALPDRERTILVLRFFGEMSQTQIAAEVGISQMHVSRLLAKTLTRLRTALSDDLPESAARA